MVKRFYLTIGLLLALQAVFSQKVVNFKTKDEVTLYAYDYHISDSLPYVILLHSESGSKMEYKDIAYKIAKLGYNCLAIDMRTGNNETSAEYKKTHPDPQPIDAQKDIEAAITFAFKKSQQPVILFGTGFSASLAMLTAKGNDSIKAVIAFSPGEYFLPTLKVEDQLAGYHKKTFVACSQMEYPYIEQLISKADSSKITLFKPGTGQGAHGIKALSTKSDGYKEYWLAVYLFFKKI